MRPLGDWTILLVMEPFPGSRTELHIVGDLYHCSNCRGFFEESEDLKKHLTEVHKKPTSLGKGGECPVCSKTEALFPATGFILNADGSYDDEDPNSEVSEACAELGT